MPSLMGIVTLAPRARRLHRLPLLRRVTYVRDRGRISGPHCATEDSTLCAQKHAFHTPPSKGSARLSAGFPASLVCCDGGGRGTSCHRHSAGGD